MLNPFRHTPKLSSVPTPRIPKAPKKPVPVKIPCDPPICWDGAPGRKPTRRQRSGNSL